MAGRGGGGSRELRIGVGKWRIALMEDRVRDLEEMVFEGRGYNNL